jgi:hypothetical protein
MATDKQKEKEEKKEKKEKKVGWVGVNMGLQRISRWIGRTRYKQGGSPCRIRSVLVGSVRVGAGIYLY